MKNFRNRNHSDQNMKTEKNIRLIALDLDGTLTNDQKEITPATKDALIACQQKGVVIALMSARPAPGLFLDRDRLDLTHYHGILASYNGGCITDAASDKILSRTSMDREQTRSILRQLEAYKVTVILDDGKQFFVTDKNGYKVEYECRNNHMSCTEVQNLADYLSFSPVKLLLSARPEKLAEVRKMVDALLPGSLITVKTAPFYFEIIPRSINKGKGLLEICRILKIDPSQTMAFGDSENDIPMLEEAGCGVAMGNADDAVKAAADIVTASNNEDGIARVLCSRILCR